MKPEPFRILVLSDIHFGSWSHYLCDANPTLKRPREWATELLRELRVCLMPPSVVSLPPYDSIVLNGDVTSLSEEDGFSATKALIRGLVRDQYIRSPKDLLLLPGNHDVVRDPGGRPLPQRKRESKFREKYHEFLGLRHASAEHLGVLHIYEKQKTALIGLDSCRLEGSDNPGIGYVGFDQLDSMIRTLELEEDKHGPFRRIAFVHHHIETPTTAPPDWVLTPKEDRRFSFTADAKRLQEALVIFHIDFLIHGHFHTPELSAVANRIRHDGRIMSAGSVAGALARCSDKTRQFMLLELSDERLTVQDFRKRGAGNWICSQEAFDLPVRRSIELSDQVSAFRMEKTYASVSELNRYGAWARAVDFFAGDADTMASLKHKLEESEIWKKDSARFEIAWTKLIHYLEKSGKSALSRYNSALQDPGDVPTLEHFVIRILKRFKA